MKIGLLSFLLLCATSARTAKALQSADILDAPSDTPSLAPSDVPSLAPSDIPSLAPSDVPSLAPSDIPSLAPSDIPSLAPSDIPSLAPSDVPSLIPSDVPSSTPVYISEQAATIPSDTPSLAPSDAPSMVPSDAPSMIPSDAPSMVPSDAPSMMPSDVPSQEPSDVPSIMPSEAPTVILRATGPVTCMPAWAKSPILSWCLAGYIANPLYTWGFLNSINLGGKYVREVWPVWANAINCDTTLGVIVGTLELHYTASTGLVQLVYIPAAGYSYTELDAQLTPPDFDPSTYQYQNAGFNYATTNQSFFLYSPEPNESELELAFHVTACQ